MELLSRLLRIVRRRSFGSSSSATLQAVANPTAEARLNVPNSVLVALREAVEPTTTRSEPLALLRVRYASEKNRRVLVGVAVEPFSDDAYVDGPDGANFDTRWLTSRANELLQINSGLMLVHSHGGSGLPAFSCTDEKTNANVVGKLAVGIDTCPYGAVVLSDLKARAILATAIGYEHLALVAIPSSSQAVL